MMNLKIFLTFLSLFFLTLHSPVVAQEKPSDPPPPPIPSKGYEAKQTLVWEKVLEALKKNEIPVATSDKDGGKITTKTKRYFRIYSASFPPVQKDYRDTYTLLLKKGENNSTLLEIDRKFEVHDKNKNQWVKGDPLKEKEGLSEERIFKEIDLLLAGTPK